MIHRDGYCIGLDGHAAEAIGDITTRVLVAGDDPDHGYRVGRQLESLLHPIDHVRRVNAGLTTTIEYLARCRGLRVCRTSTGDPVVRLDEPLRIIADDGRADTHLLRFVCQQERGVIRVGRHVELADCIAQLVMRIRSQSCLK